MTEKTTTPRLEAQEAVRIKETADRFVANVGRVIVGKPRVVEQCFVALLCEGHILMEDVPGVGKTSLARAIARSIHCSFRRVQCTPDLLPSDVTGVHVFNQKTGQFEFHPGPVVTHILLVDEINRATPRTQSCFLECMQERQVTADRETFPLPRPFMVIATQNPIELEGTFALPEAQLDRFLLRVPMGYPSEEEEIELLHRFQAAQPLDDIESVLTADELSGLQAACRRTYVADSVRSYIATVCRATRSDDSLRLGASPRASLALQQASQALAAMRGRDFVLPDDVKELAAPVLAHRVLLETRASVRGLSAASVIERIVAGVPTPVE
ncbi:MAG: MoxR family ATPase [Dehalococcoidia bacterium]|jgi:MoxR-like ATPase|nr:MoxR family ATPase [Dehalococcoidia bacterium]